jgi:dipeptidase E
LHTAGVINDIRQHVLDGLPLVAFSAGTVLCGQDILTTNDINCCNCTTFASLGLIPFNINVHYPSEDGEERQERDYHLWEYQQFHNTPVLALEDEVYIRVTGNRFEVVRGTCWWFAKGKLKANFNHELKPLGVQHMEQL